MSKTICINLCLSVALLGCGFIGALPAAHAGSRSTEETVEYNDERERLVGTLTEDYLKLLDYELGRSEDIFMKVLDDDAVQNVHTVTQEERRLELQNFVQHVVEKRQRKLPPKAHKAARFFHIFGKSLLYKEFVNIVRGLQPDDSRYDYLIQTALLRNGLENVLHSVEKRRAEFIIDCRRKIDEFIDGLTAEQKRKAAAQKLTDWSMKIESATTTEQKLDVFKELLRYEYLEVVR